MKFIIKILPLFLLSFNFLFAQSESASASGLRSDCKGILTIETDLNNSSILINDKAVGKGGAEIELRNGKYFVTAIEEIDKWNSKIFSDTVIIENCESKNLSFKFNSEIYLETDPQDAYVFKNDSLIGHTPLYLPNNLSVVSLRKSGYETKNISLIPLQAGSNKLIKLDFTGKENGKSFFEQDIFKYLIGGIVVLGGTTAYFKLKADDKFDDYQFTGDQDLLNQTRKYDLISGITFGALQINFGLLIYFFLIE